MGRRKWHPWPRKARSAPRKNNMKSVNYKMGALKRKYKLGKADVEPGTFISKANASKAKKILEKKNSKVSVAVKGLI